MNYCYFHENDCRQSICLTMWLLLRSLVEAWPRPPQSDVRPTKTAHCRFGVIIHDCLNMTHFTWYLEMQRFVFLQSLLQPFFCSFCFFAITKPDFIQGRLWRVPLLTRMERPYKRFLNGTINLQTLTFLNYMLFTRHFLFNLILHLKCMNSPIKTARGGSALLQE